MSEAEAEQVTSSVATETELEQLFDWTRYSTFNRNRNFIAYYMRFKTKQKETIKADEVHQAEQILFRFFSNRKLPECFKVDSQLQRNLKNIKHLQIVTLFRGRRNH